MKSPSEFRVLLSDRCFWEFEFYATAAAGNHDDAAFRWRGIWRPGRTM